MMKLTMLAFWVTCKAFPLAHFVDMVSGPKADVGASWNTESGDIWMIIPLNRIVNMGIVPAASRVYYFSKYQPVIPKWLASTIET